MKKVANNLLEKFLKKKISRREFVKYSLICLGAAAWGVYGTKNLLQIKNSPNVFKNSAPDDLWKWSKEAYHYKKYQDNVQCNVCPHNCLLEHNDRSICRNKVNKNGVLYTLSYGNPCSVHIDPIEKKPLFHFLPESKALSVSTAGCNFRCLNCQNWTISQMQPEETNNSDAMPASIVSAAKNNDCSSIAYTYGEPVSFYEYMYDTGKLAKENQIKNVWVTNGYINKAALKDLCSSLDAANVDLKGFDDDIYLKLNGGSLKPVLSTLKLLKQEKKWFEITNLIVPSWTDDLSRIEDMCTWLHKNGFDDYPLHFSRFHPMYKLTHLPSTPVSTLKESRKIALDKGLKFVYIGNVPGLDAENTYCPKCGKIVIGRKGYTITENNLNNGSCKFCGENISGVWEL
ncbi:MAG: AmmeMemoRadiSam system radical SAM enzyme [Nanoarchaeota archaeon]